MNLPTNRAACRIPARYVGVFILQPTFSYAAPFFSFPELPPGSFPTGYLPTLSGLQLGCFKASAAAPFPHVLHHCSQPQALRFGWPVTADAVSRDIAGKTTRQPERKHELQSRSPDSKVLYREVCFWTCLMVSMKKGLLLGTIMLVFINTRHNSEPWVHINPHSGHSALIVLVLQTGNPRQEHLQAFLSKDT